MEYLPTAVPEQGKILCCECGVPITPNPTNCCIACVRTRNDISEGIPKQGALYFCRGCERYLDPPTTWVTAPLESKELLRVCLKKLKGLNKVRLVDAGFAWTEPHSKRIKVKLQVQKEIQEGAVLQQEFLVEFVVNHQMCDECHRVEAKDFWKSAVQVRQRTDHKRTFYYLEQLMLKHRAHERALGIKPVVGGLDFFFSNEQGGRHMVDFLTSVVPCKWTPSKKLISHDIHSNVFNYKHTFAVEIVPVCKDSVVCLPRALANHLGGIGQLCVVHRVTSNIGLIDPTSGQLADVTGSVYWRFPFGSLCTSKRLTEFVVMEVGNADVLHFKGQGTLSSRHKVAEVWVQRASHLGRTGDDPVFCRSHLGGLLKPGDSVMGFDVRHANVNDDNFDALDSDRVPDVVLVKKVFADKATRNRRRRWKLRHLGVTEESLGSQNCDYTDFLEDLEEDPMLRTNVNIYKDSDKMAAVDEMSEAGDLPAIGLEEMLEDLNLQEEHEMGEEEEGAAMVV